MVRANWKSSRDPLLRGDASGGIESPAPKADRSIVRHVLYLGGAGRESPYLSTTEDAATARRFAGPRGTVYRSHVPAWRADGVKHRSRRELLQLLRGKGKGDASWSNAFEVMQARRYVEEHAEHLADFTEHAEAASAKVASVVVRLFEVVS